MSVPMKKPEKVSENHESSESPKETLRSVREAADVIAKTEMKLVDLAKKVKGAPDPPYEFEVV